MRIRSIRPEFWSSEDVAAMSWDTRLVFIGLWSYVDDNGVGRDDSRLITAALFPLDDNLTEISVSVRGALTHLSEHGQITRYRVDGRPFLHVTAWTSHQKIERASKGRYPLPTCENAEITEHSPNTHRDITDMSPPGEGEKGRRGEGEKLNTSPPAEPVKHDYPADFQEFWSEYPKKVGKDAALKVWKSAKQRATVQEIVTGAKRFAANPKRDPQYTKDPVRWLTGGHWADEPEPQRVDPYRQFRMLG